MHVRTPHQFRRLGLALAAVLLAVTACTTTESSIDDPVEAELETTESMLIDDSAPTGQSDLDANWIATGGLRYPVEWLDDDSFDAGFSMYVAAWPFQQTHPGPVYQTGLPSTWMSALESDELGLYSTIEGGLGWWTATRFPTEAPKFSMGGVSAGFFEFANGPAAGGGTEGDFDWQEWRWDQPQGKYGVAQLSPYVLFPPDALNLDVESSGGLFGYGYHPLPIVPARTIEGPEGTVAVGDKSWTLFLSTENFQGPLAFFLPEFFAEPLVQTPELGGRFGASPFLDSNPSSQNQPFDVETHDVPAVQAIANDGSVYARITTTQFPDNGDGADSIILDQVSALSSAALADDVTGWFTGGEAPLGSFDSNGVRIKRFEQMDTRDHFGWMIIPVGLEEGEPEHLIDFAAFVEVDLSDAETFRYRWDLDQVEKTDGQFVIPQYYRLVDDATAESGKVWQPVAEIDVPSETGLTEYVFPELGVRGNTTAFETPTDPDSVWNSPGPVAGPFQADLGDGSTVTYSWYRFVDQPAIRHASFTEAERALMQARVESIHRQWASDTPYLPPPVAGELASLDANVIVQPPAGLEVGYVPIVTRQALTE